jgi:hypothetical protein
MITTPNYITTQTQSAIGLSHSVSPPLKNHPHIIIYHLFLPDCRAKSNVVRIEHNDFPKLSD